MEPSFEIKPQGQQLVLNFSGDWSITSSPPHFSQLVEQLEPFPCSVLTVQMERIGEWDALFVSRLYQCALWCHQRNIELDLQAVSQNIRQLLDVALAVPPVVQPESSAAPWYQVLNPSPAIKRWWQVLVGGLRFIGEICFSLGRLVLGQANFQLRDFLYFIENTGPNALAIVGLISVLVGMILAYLGAVQLALFGAEVYVANLVTVGTLREMGALMTAILMAGRTGAAYAAQLGTMQVNEEIDAIVTLGVKPLDFLVLPRLLALLVTMPLLCIYANVLGMLGGAAVSLGMDVTMAQFITQAKESADLITVSIGIGKSFVFAWVIAIAGCKAGMACGRDSAAVGEATTKAVVNAIVWLVIADAVINISLSNLGI